MALGHLSLLLLLLGAAHSSVTNQNCGCNNACSGGMCDVDHPCSGDSGYCWGLQTWLGCAGLWYYHAPCSAPSLSISGVGSFFKPGDQISLNWASAAVSSPIKVYLMQSGLLWDSTIASTSVYFSTWGSGSASGSAALYVPGNAGDGTNYYVYAEEAQTGSKTQSGTLGTSINHISFSVSPTTLYQGEPVTFTYSSAGVPLPMYANLQSGGLLGFFSTTKYWPLNSASGSFTQVVPFEIQGATNAYINQGCGLFGCSYSSSTASVNVLSVSLGINSISPSSPAQGNTIIISFSTNSASLLSRGITFTVWSESCGVLSWLWGCDLDQPMPGCSFTATTSQAALGPYCTMHLPENQNYYIKARDASNSISAQFGPFTMSSDNPAAAFSFSSQDALRATLFSRLAYAPADALNSWKTSSMCSVCPLCAQLGTVRDITVINGDGNQAFVAALSSGEVVVSFRGTNSIENFINDVFFIWDIVTVPGLHAMQRSSRVL